MDALLVLLGALLGWGFGFGTDRWKAKQATRTAATLVRTELMENEAALPFLSGEFAGHGQSVKRIALDTYSGDLLGIRRKQVVEDVIIAYNALATLQSTRDYLVQTQQHAMESIESELTNIDSLAISRESIAASLELSAKMAQEAAVTLKNQASVEAPRVAGQIRAAMEGLKPYSQLS